MKPIIEFITSASISTGICTSVDTTPLLTAVITFGVTLVTVVGSELIKFLVSYIRKKKQDLGLEETKDEEKKEGNNNG